MNIVEPPPPGRRLRRFYIINGIKGIARPELGGGAGRDMSRAGAEGAARAGDEKIFVSVQNFVRKGKHPSVDSLIPPSRRHLVKII